MHGWVGKVLRVNLTDNCIATEPLDPKMAREFIGARGLGSKILFEEVEPAVDPLAPENKLIFATGPFTGTSAPSAGRYNVVTKGPLTGTIAASNSGGTWGPELKYAGYDLVIVEGKATTPMYLWITSSGVELRDASHLWGKTVPETSDAIRAETDPDARVASIGPAGESRVLFASIMNDLHRAAGRTGVGAVMGSKNLKAIAVKGMGGVTVADVKSFLQAVEDARLKIQRHPVGGTGLPTYGTDILANVLNQVGGLPTRNYQDGFFPTANNVGGETLAAKVLQRKKGCFACVISCGRVTKVMDTRYAGGAKGPEYESAWGFGPDCGIDDLMAITRANYICNEYGLDTITMAGTVACAMEMWENGYIGLKDTEGLALPFGDADAMVEAVRLTGVGQGFGKQLGQGSYRLASAYGHPELSMTAKKQEMPAYDARAIQGIGLNYATSNRGGCHMRGYTIEQEILGTPTKVDKDTIEGKPELVIHMQNLTAALDSAGACLFATFGIGADELATMLSALTGMTYTTDDFMQCGDRIWTMERIFNMRAGLTARDDTLPERLLKDAVKTGASKGSVSKLPEMLPAYYRLRGWDEQGVPTDAKLRGVGLA